VHISLNSPVPDDCIQYSLSDATRKDFQAICRHPHNQINDQCDDLKTILDEVKFDVEQRLFSSDDEKDNAVYTVMEACYHIAAWRAHQLRTINQEMAKQDILDTLNDQTVLITQELSDEISAPALPRVTRKLFRQEGNILAFDVRCKKKSEHSLFSVFCPHC
jgi:hypothetical protein